MCKETDRDARDPPAGGGYAQPEIAAPEPWHGARLYPEAALICTALVAWAFMLRVQPMNDVVWQFWIARQLLGGARLYADIWELNPPLWFWSAVPVEWLAERTGVGWAALLATLMAGLGGVAAWLTGRLLGPLPAHQRLVLMLLVFAMALVVPMLGMGQREQLALIASLPYAALIASRRAGVTVPIALAAGVGLLGAYGFALKHYFALVPLVLELWLAAGLRRDWRALRPELAALGGVAVTYAVCVLAFAPEFLTVMVPMVQAAYYAFEPSLLFVLVKPYVLFWAMAGLFLLLTRDAPQAATSSAMAAYFRALLLVAACFALSYVIQRRGWDYHSIPATGALGVAAGLRLMRLRRLWAIAMGGAVLVWLVCNVYPLGQHRPGYDPVLDRVPVGEAVFVASADAGAAWPAPDRRGLIWVSRAYSLWMVPAIVKNESIGPQTPELRALAARVLAASSADIRCNPPWLIVMEPLPARGSGHGAATFESFLLRDPQLRHFVADHYVTGPAIPSGTSYVRRGPVARAAGLRCRTIRLAGRR